MSGTDPPSLPRISSLGWSIDDASDLRSAIFDLADGTTDSAVTTSWSSSNKQQTSPKRPNAGKRAASQPHLRLSSTSPRAPLREWPEPGGMPNRSTSDAVHHRTAYDTHMPPQHGTSSRSATPVSRTEQARQQYPPSSSANTKAAKASRSSMTSRAFGLPSIDMGYVLPDPEYLIASTRTQTASTGASQSTRPSTGASQSTRPSTSGSYPSRDDAKQPVSRSGSMFRLRRPFGKKKVFEAPAESPEFDQRNVVHHIGPGDDYERKRLPSRPRTAPTRESGEPRKRFADTPSGLGDESVSERTTTGSSRQSATSSRGEESYLSYKSAIGSPDLDDHFLAHSSTRFHPPPLARDEQDIHIIGVDEDRSLLYNQQHTTLTNGRNLAEGSTSEGTTQSLDASPLLPRASLYASLAPSGSVRRRPRDLRPAAPAPKSPLPMPPVPGDPSSDLDDLLLDSRTPPVSRGNSSNYNNDGQSRLNSVDSAKIVRKSKSQSSMRLLRRPSFLSALRQPSGGASPTNADRKLSDESARKGAARKNGTYELGDSSPEVQRKSLPSSSAEDLRESMTSTPSLEEVRQVLSPMLLNVPLPSNDGNSLIIPPKNGSRSPQSGGGRSRLDSSGGASGLFGNEGGGSRQRTTSLLPWRSRGNSQVSLTTSNQSVSPGPLTPSSESVATPAPVAKTEKIDTSIFDGNAEAFLKHVNATVPRSEVPAILAASGDALHKSALHMYMQRFLFAGHPLDVALRKLLMTLCLPKETQQIDRVMEAFAQRYNECNDNLFVNNDQPYVLAFSLMMLHTDTFNRNAKQKMTKADYVRNTSASGVPAEILEYLYDNLTFTQFIYVEDDDFLQRRKAEGGAGGDVASALRSAFTSSSSSSSKNRMDPYHIIASGQTHTLRPDVRIEEDSPFAFTGSVPGFNFETLLKSFVNAPSIEVVTARKAQVPTPQNAALGSYYSMLPSVLKEEETIVTLRITKVGCISRKDDLAENNKKAQSRKWKTCGMILTSSQLLFFRDLVWTSALDQRITEQMREQPDLEGGVTITPRITYFKPDGVLALGDAVAVRDATYTKYKHVFRLVARQGDMNRQYLIQTSSEDEMNDWIHKINLCAAFRSAGLRIRGLEIVQENEERQLDTSAPSTPDGESGVPPASPGAASTSSSVASTTTATSANATRVDLLRRKLNARLREFTPIIGKVNASLHKSQAALDDKLRLARHLMIATPFTKTARERLEAVAVSLSSEILQLRLEVARYSCRKEMLILELEAGNRAVKASAPPSPSVSHFPNTASPSSLTPLDMNRSGSLGGSRASSLSQSRAGSFSIGEAHEPMPTLPTSIDADEFTAPSAPDADVFVVSNIISGAKALPTEADVVTPTMRRVALPEVEGEHSSGGNGGDPGVSRSQSKDFPLSPTIDDSGNYAESHDSSVPVGSPRSPKVRGGNNRGPRASPPPSSRFHHFVTHSSPTRPPPTREEQVERWDRTKMGRNTDKRVSLVDLPDPQQWQTLTPKLAMRVAGRLAGHDDDDDVNQAS